MKILNSKKFWIFLALIFAVCAWWELSYPEGSLRYRTTVKVQTPEGIKTGSAVREIHIRAAPGISSKFASRRSLHGEAVVIDLGKRGVLFALLRGQNGWEDWGKLIVHRIFPDGTDNLPDSIRYYDRLSEGHAVLIPRDYPMFSTFTDPKDWRSVEVVSPDTLSQKFGEGVELKEVSFEITKEPVTREIVHYLPPLDTKEKYQAYLKWRASMSMSDPRNHGTEAYWMPQQ